MISSTNSEITPETLFPYIVVYTRIDYGYKDLPVKTINYILGSNGIDINLPEIKEGQTRSFTVALEGLYVYVDVFIDGKHIRSGSHIFANSVQEWEQFQLQNALLPKSESEVDGIDEALKSCEHLYNALVKFTKVSPSIQQKGENFSTEKVCNHG